jgi:capsular exopolysaccharide synthesis family protein
MKQRRAVMLIEAGENWPEVKELNKQISLLEQELKQTRQNAIRVTLTNLETKYHQALAREQALRRSFEEQHVDTMDQKASEIDYRIIKQENATYTGLLDNLLQRSKENDVILAATPNNVHVTDYSTRPLVPVGPRRLRLVGLALAASLAFGVGVAVLLGSLEDTVRVDSRERVETMLGLPALSVVPDAKRRQFLSRQALQRRNHNGRTGLLLDAEQSSPLAESFRKLRTSLVFSVPKRAATRLLVTSSLPGEGKSTAVVNAGLVMSQNGSKILLVDGDLRHPTLHKLLSIKNDVGLSTLLTNDLEETDPRSVIQQYGDTNLYVLPCGPVPDDSSELLSSGRLSTLLETLNGDFSRIIIDSPPIGFFSDALIISTVVDGVIMVVRGPKTSRQIARYTMQSLDEVGAPILGVVLNAVTPHTKNYSYYRNQYT